jgi:hypothetical protein
MGRKIIPFILEKMADGEIHVQWFPLLKRASGQDPVPSDKRGKIRDMASHWVVWGRLNGYIKGNAR